MLDQRIVTYSDADGIRHIYDSAYDVDQIRSAVSNCRLAHHGSTPQDYPLDAG